MTDRDTETIIRNQCCPPTCAGSADLGSLPALASSARSRQLITVVGGELPVPQVEEAALPPRTDPLGTSGAAQSELLADDYFIRWAGRSRGPATWRCSALGRAVASSGSRPLSRHAVLSSECSWIPTNTTAGELCQMTNAGDLPEGFLLVSMDTCNLPPALAAACCGCRPVVAAASSRCKRAPCSLVPPQLTSAARVAF
jgi:hypothetical protein